jgi:hypothetical protein
MWTEHKKGEENQGAPALSVETVARVVDEAGKAAEGVEKMVDKVMGMWRTEEEPKEAGVLVFGKEAWLKAAVWAKAAEGEVTMMGVTRDKDSLYVEDVVLLEQEATTGSVDMYGDALAAHMEGCAAKGIEPRRCMRVWIHTHPVGVTAPSGTDWRTFRETFGGGDHAVMFIMCAESGWRCAKLAVAWEGVRFESDLKVWTPELRGVGVDREVVRGLVEEFGSKVKAPAAHVWDAAGPGRGPVVNLGGYSGLGMYGEPMDDGWGEYREEAAAANVDVKGEEAAIAFVREVVDQVLVLKKGGVWGMVDVKDLWDGALGRIGRSVYRYTKKNNSWTIMEEGACPSSVGEGGRYADAVPAGAGGDGKIEDVMEKVLRAEALSGEEVMWVLDRLVDEAEDVCEVMRAADAAAEDVNDAEEVADSFRAAREQVEALDGWPDKWVEPTGDRMWE